MENIIESIVFLIFVISGLIFSIIFGIMNYSSAKEDLCDKRLRKYITTSDKTHLRIETILGVIAGFLVNLLFWFVINLVLIIGLETYQCVEFLCNNFK